MRFGLIDFTHRREIHTGARLARAGSTLFAESLVHDEIFRINKKRTNDGDPAAPHGGWWVSTEGGRLVYCSALDRTRSFKHGVGSVRPFDAPSCA